MSSAIRWAVLRDRYPFTVGEVIGHVHAPDKRAALLEAQQLHGAKVLVQSVASLKVGAKEKPLPLPDPKRDSYGLKKRSHQRGLQRPKARGPHDPRGPRRKALGGEL